MNSDSSRYLATGDLLISFHYSYLLGTSTIHNIVKETCSAIWTTLCPLLLPSEITEEQWVQISQDFETMWNFPNAIAALDGKHIQIQVLFKKIQAIFAYGKLLINIHLFSLRNQ